MMNTRVQTALLLTLITVCHTFGVSPAHAGPRSQYKTYWPTCRAALMPERGEPELAYEFTDLESFSRAVFTGDRQISPADGARLKNIQHIPPQLLQNFVVDPARIEGLREWLVSGKALQHPDPSIYTYFKQLLLPGELGVSLNEEELRYFSWFISALSVFKESEALLEEGPINLTRAHMELEFYVPRLSEHDREYNRIAHDERFSKKIKGLKTQEFKTDMVSMLHWMQTMGASDNMFKTYMRMSTHWRRELPDIDIAVHNPKYGSARSRKSGVKPFLRVCQVKSNIYNIKKLDEIFTKLISIPVLGQVALFPAELTHKRVIVLQLRGLQEQDFEKVFLEMQKKVAAAATEYNIAFQLNGDTRTATIRP